MFKAKALDLQLMFRNGVDSSVFVLIDCNKMSQVIRNLVSNALKFSHPGGKVIVSVELLEEQNDHSISISNDRLEVFHNDICDPDVESRILKSHPNDPYHWLSKHIWHPSSPQSNSFHSFSNVPKLDRAGSKKIARIKVHDNGAGISKVSIYHHQPLNDEL